MGGTIHVHNLLNEGTFSFDIKLHSDFDFEKQLSSSNNRFNVKKALILDEKEHGFLSGVGIFSL
jgi:hypothetical protein